SISVFNVNDFPSDLPLSFFYGSHHHHPLHSFPTRRSSDLQRSREPRLRSEGACHAPPGEHYEVLEDGPRAVMLVPRLAVAGAGVPRHRSEAVPARPSDGNRVTARHSGPRASEFRLQAHGGGACDHQELGHPSQMKMEM